MADNYSQYLKACSEGRLDLAKQLQVRIPMENSGVLHDALLDAIKKKHHPIVELLLQNAPADFTSHFPDPILLQAIDASPQIYALFIHKEPSVARRSFGHMGDALALSVIRNDATLVRLLLDNGAAPADSKLFYKPIIVVAQDMQNIDVEIIRMLSEANTKK